MRDFNEGRDGNRSQHYGDRPSGSHPNGHGPYGDRASGSHPNGHGQQTMQLNRYLRFDRESIRQIVLVQNTTFRSQVHELHRLYNRQKELMEELRKNGYLQADASQSNYDASQIPCDGTNKMRHIPHLPATSTSYNKEPVTMNDEKVVTINFLKESGTHSGPVSIAERISIENGDLKHKRHTRRMFDLQLPADAYIDCEDAEKSEKEIVAESSSVNMFPLKGTQAADHENDVKLALGTSEGLSYGEDSWKSDSCTQNGVRVLADLNEPVKENFSERAAGSVSYNFLNRRTSLEENQDHHLPSPQSSLFRASHNEQGTCPNHLIAADEKEIIQERQFFNNEAGRNTTTMAALFSTASSKWNFSISSEAPQPKFKKPVEIVPPNQNKRRTPSRQNQGQGIEISGRRTPYEQSTAPSVPPSSFSVFPDRDYTDPQNGAAARNHSRPWENLPILGADPPSRRNSFNNGSSQMDYSRASQLNLPQMIFGKQNLNSRLDNSTDRHGLTSSSGLRKNPACLISSRMELDFSRGYPHLKPSGSAMYQGTENTQEAEKSRKRKSVEQSNGPSSKRLFGISILDGTRQSPAFAASRQEEQPVTGITKCSKKDEKKKKKATGSKTRKSNSRGLTNRIDLNSDPSSGKMVDSEALAKEAAETIVWMFSSKEQNHLDDISSDRLTDGPSSTLHWFAEVVSADAASPDDGLDLFEQMTLSLEETKPEDYLCTPWKLEDRKEEEEEEEDADKKGNAASLLFTKHRRGQGKKRRQRRDFQRDILPGLASLSRREVAEDIQTFSVLMKASGQSWQSGVNKKRNKGHNVATNSRPRGRHQPPPPAVSVAATNNDNNNNNTEVEVEGGNIKECAKTTTRRCRRQRCPPATNVPAPMA